MDIVNLKILRAYQSFPELSMTELADKVGLSHTACWKRLKRMEKDGYIEGRAVLLNQKLLGLNVSVIARVKLEQNATKVLDRFEQAVQECSEIISCYSTSGDSDYHLLIVAKSIEDYEVFMKEKLAKLPHVASLNSSFVLKTIKNTMILPI